MPRHARSFVLSAALLASAALEARAQTQPVAAADAPPARVRADRPAVTEAAEPELVLESELWRNFQPSTGVPDTRLVVLLRLHTADGRPLPGGLTVERAWIACAVERCAGERWSVVPRREEEPPYAADVLEVVARGGPAWDTSATVDVTVEVRDERGRTRRMTLRAQPVRRLD